MSRLRFWVILMVIAAVLAGLSVTAFFWSQNQQNQVKFQDLGSLQKGVGINWWFFHQDFPDEGKMQVTFATDGNLYVGDFMITKSSGEKLGTVKAYLKGFYLDSSGQKRSVLLPVLFQFPDGREYLSANIRNPEVVWADKDIKSNIEKSGFLSQYINGNPGRLITVLLVTNLNIFQSKYNLSGISLDKLRLIDEYNNSWGMFINDFYVSGDSRVKTIFLYEVLDSKPQKVDL